MILLCGIPSETPLRLTADRLTSRAAPFVIFNQRDFWDSEIVFEVAGGRISGELRIKERTYSLERFGAVYSRMMDDRYLPELVAEPPESALRTYCRSFHDTLTRWMEIAPAKVINRCAPMATNSSKPYQTQLVREAGFLIPETLITNEPELVREFCSRYGRVIYKSISATRSIVQTMEKEDFERLERIRWCPTQFQAFVPGKDLRVHVIGEEVFATAINADATDYRYASRQTGEPAELLEAELSPELAEKCVQLANGLGLVFAGIDLKVTPDDEVYCFEVNPCPAFSYYEANTGQPISDGVARCLMAACQ
jgi:glutathione synthase/RimK-type ligase-like ATP-grasp enzyme